MRTTFNPLLTVCKKLKKVKTSHSHGEHIQRFSRGSDDFKVVLQDGDGAS